MKSKNLDIEYQNLDIGSKNLDIERKKLDIEAACKSLKYSKATKEKIVALDLVEYVTGHGKGKYKFKP